MAVSPYSPFGAYVAVSFQAVFGAFLFSKFSWKGITIMILGCVTFLESALQKLLILTIVYGTELWEAINIYGAWVQQKLAFLTETSATSVLVTTYLLVYGICGILAGFTIKEIIRIISNKKEEDFYLELEVGTGLNRNSKSTFKTKIIWLWLITVAVIVLAFSFFGGNLFGWKKGLYVMLRSFLILMLWYLILGPLLLKFVRKYLKKKESQYQEDITIAMDLFPYFRKIIAMTWKETKHFNGYHRIKNFMAISIYNCMHFKLPSE